MLSLRTCSLRRYRVEGTLPAPRSEAFIRRLTDRRFVPLGAHEERTYGWVQADNLLLTRFDADTLERGSHVAFALRIDRRRVDGRLLRAQVELEIGARLDATRAAGGTARLGREERRQLRKDLHDEMLRQTNPTVAVHPVLLEPTRRTVAFLTRSRVANDVLRVLFHDTFDVELLPLTPWRRAGELLDARGRPEGLDPLRRAEFGSAQPLLAEAVR